MVSLNRTLCFFYCALIVIVMADAVSAGRTYSSWRNSAGKEALHEATFQVLMKSRKIRTSDPSHGSNVGPVTFKQFNSVPSPGVGN
ncbi:hypothetical protein JCGZ_21604 [Jatropha curcas]|uniref:Uncharacterized protein n=1 Tax=Jatropha curcas TaxID=180498 RepID=A0A067JED7_JATCU|nr:hypothetical protein JCGZ_21604 [Jatropha curcas]